MNKKVIYVSWAKLTDKYARDYFIDHLIANGVEVEFWDVVAYMREPHNEIGELDVDYLRVLQSYGEFENLVKLNENNDTVYVLMINLCWEVRSVYQLLSKYRCKTAFLSWGAMPAATEPILQRAATKLIKEPSRFFNILVKKFFLLSYLQLGLIKPFDVVFTAGSLLGEEDLPSKKKIKFNSFDYAHYLHALEIDNSFSCEKYAVFLDLNMPYHSDLAREGLKTVNPHDYYQSLNRFFSLLEKQSDVKVIIAAHPKTNTSTSAFGDRRVYRLKTAEIVKEAEFVITHHSTSLSYAVLNIKPCIFIYTNEMKKLYSNSRIREIKSFADYLDAPVYNIDKLNSTDRVVIKQPNRLRYNDYKYSFVTSKETETEKSEDIFLQEINQI